MANDLDPDTRSQTDGRTDAHSLSYVMTAQSLAAIAMCAGCLSWQSVAAQACSGFLGYRVNMDPLRPVIGFVY